MTSQLEFDDPQFFDVISLQPKADVLFGEKFAFAVMDPATDISLLEGPALFNVAGNRTSINFHASHVVLFPKKDFPALSAPELKTRFDFGFVQGIRQTTLVVQYWGEHRGHGRTILAINGSNGFEVDTTDATKPFTTFAAGRFTATPHLPQKAGFHAFKIGAKFGDGPLWRLRHTIDSKSNSSSAMMSVKHYIRSISTERYFVSIFCGREKSTGDFTAISATEWQVVHRHTIDYTVKPDGSLARAVSGPAGSFPKGGNPASIGPVHKQILAMAKAGAPLLTPVVLDNRVNAGDRSDEDTNPDFVDSFWTKQKR
ncbi:MAG: hypothetical protein H7Y08_03775 [Rhizobiaceae bacterium]|nr:hypothetical protein [Rhizobiaceae bacterium]